MLSNGTVQVKDKHHFVSVSYLVGFTDGTGRSGSIFVYDKQENRIYRNSTENVGYIKGYYKINAVGLTEDAVENAFAEVEAAAIPVLRQMVTHLAMPDGEDLKTFLYFLSLFGSRVPAIRNNFVRSMQELMRITAHVYFANATPEILHRDLKRASIDDNDFSDFEKLKEFALSDRYGIKIDQTYQVSMSIYLANIIYSLLFERNWYFMYRTPNMSNYFVTSDCPLLLIWKEYMPGPYGPGFGLPDTRVVFALDKDVLLLGDLEKVPNRPIRARNRFIRVFNSYHTAMSERFVYSYQEDYGLIDNNGRPVSLADYIEHRS